MPSAGPSSSLDAPVYETQFRPLPGDDENLWDALEILKERKHRYLVRWAGVDPATQKPWAPSWVPKHDCTNELIRDWKKSRAKKRAPAPAHDERAYDPRRSTSVRMKSTSRSGTAASRGPPPTASPAGKTSPVVEITRLKKRPRESRRSDVDLPDDEGEAVAPTKKKRKLAPPPPQRLEEEEEDRQESPPPPTPPQRHEEEEEEEEEQQESPPSATIHEVKPQSAGKKQQPSAPSSHETDADGSIVVDEDEDEEDPVERKSRTDGSQYAHFDKQDYDMDGPDAYDDLFAFDEHAPPSFPSPRALLSSPKKRAESVVAETQSSISPAPPRAIPPANGPPAKKPRTAEKDAAPARADRKALRPVPSISPSRFQAHIAKARAASPASQASEIETFTSPRKSTQAKRRALFLPEDDSGSFPSGTPYVGDRLHPNNEDSAAEGRRRRTPAQKAHKRTLDEVLSTHRSSAHADSESGPRGSLSDHANNRAQRLSREASVSTDYAPIQAFNKRAGQSSQALQEASQSSATDGEQVQRITGRKRRWIEEDAEVETSQATDTDRPSGQDDSHLSATSDSEYPLGGVDDIAKGDLVDPIELGPDDAPDARSVSPRRSGEVHATPSTPAKVNFSLAATGPWTQDSRSQLATIGSPIKQLDKAIGLLHLKSLEIDELKAAAEQLRRKLGAAEAHLSIAERRYDEVSAMLDIEKVQRNAVENSAPADEEQILQLLQENERLKSTNKALESDKVLLGDLYTRASDAHQRVLAENTALVRDNQSLRAQATTGVKQAGVFWKTQVQTLETELARVKGTVKVFADQAQRTDDTVRRRAALLPMAQRDTLDALEQVEKLEVQIGDLGLENTILRLQVKSWEDEAMARRKEREDAARREEESAEDELVWVCHWIDAERQTKCAALLESREKLREHFYEAGHV